MGVVKDAPHPNAARLFEAYVLSPEGQALDLAVLDPLSERDQAVTEAPLYFQKRWGYHPTGNQSRSRLLHRFPDETPFEEQMRINQFDYLLASERAAATLAEQYVGLPY